MLSLLQEWKRVQDERRIADDVAKRLLESLAPLSFSTRLFTGEPGKVIKWNPPVWWANCGTYKEKLQAIEDRFTADKIARRLLGAESSQWSVKITDGTNATTPYDTKQAETQQAATTGKTAASAAAAYFKARATRY